MSALIGLQCHLCQSVFPAEATYVCEKCLGPLEPLYDYSAIRLTRETIAARPFLAGVDGDWITRTRSSLRDTRVRALECLGAVALANREHPLAAQLSREVVELEPFRETGWQRLMHALDRSARLLALD